MATYGVAVSNRAQAAERERTEAKARALSWLDAARIVSVLAVVMLHAAAPLTWHFDQQTNWWVGNVFNSAGRWCVPVFVMVSGALLLDPARRGGALSFYRRRFTRIGLPLVAWTLVYFAWVELRSGNPPSLTGDIVGVAEGRPYYHLWFLYMLVGLYLLTPILRHFTASASRRELTAVVAVLLALGMADSFARFVLQVGQPNAVTLFVPYVGLYLGGYLVRRYAQPAPNAVPWLAAIFVLSLAVTAGLNFVLYRIGMSRGGDFITDYLSPTTIVASFSLFMLLAGLMDGSWAARHPRVASAVTFGGVASFGVYLVHPMFLEAVPGVLGWSVFTGIPALSLPAMIVLVFGLSLVVTAAIQRIPVLRTLV